MRREGRGKWGRGDAGGIYRFTGCCLMREVEKDCYRFRSGWKRRRENAWISEQV